MARISLDENEHAIVQLQRLAEDYALTDIIIIPETLNDEMKAKVARRLYKNMTLEQMEELERTAGTICRENRRTYNIHV